MESEPGHTVFILELAGAAGSDRDRGPGDDGAGLLETPFTAQALLRAVEQVSA